MLTSQTNKDIEKAPQRRKEAEENLPGYLSLIDRLKAAVGLQHQLTTLTQTTMPATEAELQEAQTKSRAAADLFADARRKAADLEEDMAALRKLGSVADGVASALKVINVEKRKIATFEGDLQATGSTRTSEDCQADIDKVSAAECVRRGAGPRLTTTGRATRRRSARSSARRSSARTMRRSSTVAPTSSRATSTPRSSRSPSARALRRASRRSRPISRRTRRRTRCATPFETAD